MADQIVAAATASSSGVSVCVFFLVSSIYGNTMFCFFATLPLEQAKSTEMQSRYYQSDDNLQLHYLYHSHPTASSCCLLLHGFTNDAHIFDGLSQQLAKNHNVIAIDFRGHGDSAWDPQAQYNHSQLVTDIWQLIESQSFSAWHIIGHSLGARAGLLLCARKQFVPATFTITDTGPEVRAVGVNKVRKDAQSAPTEFVDENAFYEYLSNIYLFGQTDRVKQMAHHGLKYADGKWIPKTDPAFTTALWKPESTQGNADDLRAPLNEELWDALTQIRCPAMVLRGQASAILGRDVAQRMVEESLPKGQLQTIPRAGHALMVDNPAAFEAAVIDFIQQYQGD